MLAEVSRSSGVSDCNTDLIEGEVLFLGASNNGEMRYFMRRGELGDYQVIEKSTKELGQEQCLLELAPYIIWERAFAKLDKDNKMIGFDIKRASRWIIERSRAGIAGIYNSDRIRGRGVWKEADGYVMHLGNELLIGDNHQKLGEINSQYVYPRLEQIELAASKELSEDQTDLIVQASKLFDWKDPLLHSVLFSGWCALAPVCGGLDWRPHLWVNAPAGAGKSTLMSIAADLTSNFHLVIQSANDTSTAGLRISIGQDAMPVLFDEAEGGGNRERSRKMQEILALIRVSSSEGEGSIRKGTAAQTVREYKLRNMFMLASINNSLKEEQDKQRFIQLTISKPPSQSSQESEARIAQWNQLKQVRKNFNVMFAGGLLLRSAKLLVVIRHNIDVFMPILNDIFGNMRKAASYATLFAGHISLLHRNKITPEEAEMFVNKFNLEESEVCEIEQGAEVGLFNHLLQSIVEIEDSDGVRTKKTIGELVEMALEGNHPASEWLQRYGLKADVTRQRIFIANSHPFLEKVFTDTLGSTGWGQVFKHIQGAASDTRRLSGLPNPVRGWAIPYKEEETIIGDTPF